MKNENKKSPNINEKFADNEFIKDTSKNGVFIGKKSNESEVKLIDFNNNVNTNYVTLGKAGIGMNWLIKSKMIQR